MNKLFLTLVPFILLGCVNKYQKHYTAYVPTEVIDTHPKIQKNDGEPKIVKLATNDINTIIKQYQRRGYTHVGSSFFNAADASDENLIKFAKQLGSHVVVRGSQYTHTQTGAAPVVMPTTNTVHHSGAVGGVPYGGTSTIHGTQTMMMPYSVDRKDFIALYFNKKRPGGLGIGYSETTIEQRKLIESNKGITVVYVVDGSSAFRGDLLEDDVIIAVNGQTIASVGEALPVIESVYGQSDVEFTIFRKGKTITKVLDVDPFPLN